MKIYGIKTISLACLLSSAFLCTTAKAGLVTYSDYTLDTDAGIVTGGGLEWLRWDLTLGRTIDGALNEISDGIVDGVDYGTGWRVATNIDMSGLFTDFFGNFGSFDTEESTRDEINDVYSPNDDPNDDVFASFTELYGVTRVFGDQNQNDTAQLQSMALFGLELNGNNFVNLARVDEDYTTQFSSIGGRAFLDIDFRLITSPSSVQGVALVRDTTLIPDPDPDLNPTPVPSPSSIGFLALSVFLFGRVLKTKLSDRFL